MLRLNRGLLVVGLVACAVAPVAGQSRLLDEVHECRLESLRTAAARLDSRRCFESEEGWFLTTDSVWASLASTAVREGAARFQRIFGEPIGRGVILHIPADTSIRRSWNDSLQQVFSQADWTWNLPVSRDTADDLAQQLQAFGGLERHEMGHRWFGLWSKRQGGKDTIPYWMLEAPAILMEDSATTATRYQNLKLLPAQMTSLIPLEELFTMENPAVRLVGKTNSDPQDAVQGELFYDECRALFDFLVARTGDPGVFGSIALSVIHGTTMAQWLQANGARYGLPTTVQALDQEWQRWLP